MLCLRLLVPVLFAATLADGADGPPPTGPDAVARATRIDAPAFVPPVLRDLEPRDTSVVKLPGFRRSITALPATLPNTPQLAATAPVAPATVPRPRALAAPEPEYPADFKRESALYCQKQIGRWTESVARALLGGPERRRLAADDDGVDGADGHILAFSDPTRRYRELELDFDRTTGLLRAIFAYPQELTWRDCRHSWGAKFTVAKAGTGRMFYSYLNHHLDVLVSSAGRVISLGLY
jgi:hypothetical protein